MQDERTGNYYHKTKSLKIVSNKIHSYIDLYNHRCIYLDIKCGISSKILYDFLFYIISSNYFYVPIYFKYKKPPTIKWVFFRKY